MNDAAESRDTCDDSRGEIGARLAIGPAVVAGGDRRRERNWCERGDSNPHGLPHWHLKPARLPVPPLSRSPTAAQYKATAVEQRMAGRKRMCEGRPAHARKLETSVRICQSCGANSLAAITHGAGAAGRRRRTWAVRARQARGASSPRVPGRARTEDESVAPGSGAIRPSPHNRDRRRDNHVR